jgi:excisionase family DNA binding protein
MENLMIIIKDKKELFDVLNEWEASKVSIKKNEIKDPEEIYFTQREAARFLRITLPTLIAWKKSRKIPFYQHGRKILFKKSEILEAMKNSVI